MGTYEDITDSAKLLSAVVRASVRGECDEDTPEPVKLLVTRAKGGDVEAAGRLCLLGIRAAYVVLDLADVRDVMQDPPTS